MFFKLLYEMAELQELNKKYLSDMKKKLRVAKKKFFRAYRFYCLGTIPYHPFLEKYAIPLTNIVGKIQEFKEFFEELNVKFPQLPDFEDLIDRSVTFWYQNNSIVEDLIYKGETINIEYDHYTDSLLEYWQEYIF